MARAPTQKAHLTVPGVLGRAWIHAGFIRAREGRRSIAAPLSNVCLTSRSLADRALLRLRDAARLAVVVGPDNLHVPEMIGRGAPGPGVIAPLDRRLSRRPRKRRRLGDVLDG